MDYFCYEGGTLRCEGIRVADVAKEVGTPAYIYSRRSFVEHYRRLVAAFEAIDPLVCYSVKANANLAVLKILLDEGAGFDVVSGGELYRVLRIGADAHKCVFAGVGKTPAEISLGLDHGICMFNVESGGELWHLNTIALASGKRAPVALRINPDVDPETHAYITTGKRENKFGVDLRTAANLLRDAREMRGVEIRGVHCHIGSQITRVEPYVETLTKAVGFIEFARRQGHPVDTLNMGGGFGVFYRGDEARTAEEYARAVTPIVSGTHCRLILEPGRFIMGNAGVLVTRVLYVKHSGDRRFVIVDGSMTDLIRPMLYGATHKIWPVDADAPPPTPGEESDAEGLEQVDVVGPVCESGDVFAVDRRVPPLRPGDLVAIFGAGAYGHVMASNYNGRPRPVEALVEGDAFRLVRRRETYEDLVRDEILYY